MFIVSQNLDLKKYSLLSFSTFIKYTDHYGFRITSSYSSTNFIYSETAFL
jgi:hypothetical protein